MSTEANILCPSANHKEPDAVLFVVVGGTAERPEVAYLDETQAITDEILAMAGSVDPTEVFRFAAPCAKTGVSISMVNKHAVNSRQKSSNSYRLRLIN